MYSCNGDVRMCPYEIANVGGKIATNLDMENAKDVVPVTSYQEEAEDDDHYAAMEESLKRDGLYTGLPLYERFISKSERDSADEGDFAGKGKSFPILKPEDVSAAVHAMGRAGDKNVGTSTLKSRIIAIATKKGWTKYLPKAWQSDSASKEASVPRETPGQLKLVESTDWKEDALRLIESGGPVRMPLKLISPGKGSSAFYPAEVLKRDGPNVFTKGTHIYINHATTAEEAARPEGDWHKLVGALEGNAYYDVNGKQGEGLYGYGLFTSDMAPLIKEKASFTGMSIRANGIAESGKQKDGLPILKELTSAESVDVVTRAGAGGMILTEAAKPGNSQEGEMTLQEAQKLIDEGIAKATSPLIERGIRLDAREEATRILEGTAFKEARFAPARAKIIEAALRNVPKKDGALDVEEFRKVVAQEAKDMGAFLGEMLEPGTVRGLGPAFGAPPAADPVKVAEARKREEEELVRLDEAERSVFGELTGLQLVKKEKVA